jgi:hypothetical protein
VEERPRRGYVKLVFETEAGQEVSFMRVIQPSGGADADAYASVYKVDDRTVSWDAYAARLGGFGILVKVRNFLVFQVREGRRWGRRPPRGARAPSAAAPLPPASASHPMQTVAAHGAAAHPTTQYMAQGACMAMEDAVTLGEALRAHQNDWPQALDTYQRARVARTARIVLSSREMGRIYHAKGVERLVRNDLWRGRSPEGFYDAMQWLYGWNVGNCLDAAQHSA